MGTRASLTRHTCEFVKLAVIRTVNSKAWMFGAGYDVEAFSSLASVTDMH